MSVIIMPQLVEPRPEFQSVTADEVRAALDDPDPLNPVAQEIARLLDGYTRNFVALVQRLGYIPSHALRVKPRTQIEAVAMAMMTEALKKQSSVLIEPRKPGQ